MSNGFTCTMCSAVLEDGNEKCPKCGWISDRIKPTEPMAFSAPSLSAQTPQTISAGVPVTGSAPPSAARPASSATKGCLISCVLFPIAAFLGLGLLGTLSPKYDKHTAEGRLAIIHTNFTGGAYDPAVEAEFARILKHATKETTSSRDEAADAIATTYDILKPEKPNITLLSTARAIDQVIIPRAGELKGRVTLKELCSTYAILLRDSEAK